MNEPGFTRDINLASSGLGAEGLFASDAFFAPLQRMLADAAPVFHPDKYDAHGKWMDGWETRRRRGPGHDHAIIRLAAPGRLTGFTVDTAHFTGNYPQACAIDACYTDGVPDDATRWTPLVPPRPLGPDAPHHFACSDANVWSHLRLSIHPDGGIARLRAHGRPHLDRAALAGQSLDLAGARNGGRVLGYSNAHYGRVHRLLAPGRGLDMGDGWETRRRREPGFDWLIVALGARGVIERIEIDTAHYKGNFPDSASLNAADLSASADDLADTIIARAMFWPQLLRAHKLHADHVHSFDDLSELGPVSHVRLNIHPDGGVSRLRLFGRLA